LQNRRRRAASLAVFIRSPWRVHAVRVCTGPPAISDVIPQNRSPATG
jgi:hypothetical protein